MSNRFLTVREAGELLRVGPATIYQYIYSGRLPYLKIRGKILIPADELERFIQKHILLVVKLTPQFFAFFLHPDLNRNV